MKHLLWAVIGFTGLAIALVWQLSSVVRCVRLSAAGVAARATVTAYEDHHIQSRGATLLERHYTVEYDGHTFDDLISSESLRQVGDHISVVYLSNDPDIVTVGTESDSMFKLLWRKHGSMMFLWIWLLPLFGFLGGMSLYQYRQERRDT